MSVPVGVKPDFGSLLPVIVSSSLSKDKSADWRKYVLPVMALTRNQDWLAKFSWKSVFENRLHRESWGG